MKHVKVIKIMKKKKSLSVFNRKIIPYELILQSYIVEAYTISEEEK